MNDYLVIIQFDYEYSDDLVRKIDDAIDYLNDNIGFVQKYCDTEEQYKYEKPYAYFSVKSELSELQIKQKLHDKTEFIDFDVKTIMNKR